MDFLKDLNHQQTQAVKAGPGPVLIVAGPGTGKTKTLTARIAYLLASGQARPDEILALTFTNKAAAEMRERVVAAIGSAHNQPRIATFHALCREMLSEHLGKPLIFIGQAERVALIKDLRKTAAFKQLTTHELATQISRAKNSLTPDYDEQFTALLADYNAALYRKGLHDFDDLLMQTHTLLTNAGVGKLRFRYLLIDEFQDTSQLQYSLMQLLRATDNLFVIGDPKQSIYGFRGITDDMFERFKTDFPHHKNIMLTTNYRSTPQVVELGNAIFPEAPALRAHRQLDGTAATVQVLNEYSEAAWIVDAIEQALGGTDFLRSHAASQAEDQTRQFRDYAVLYRTHRTAKVLQRELDRSGIPYQVVGEGSPYEQSAVKTIIQTLRYLEYDAELPELKDFSTAQTRQLLAALRTKNPMLSTQLVHKIITTFGMANEGSNLSQFMSALVRFDHEGIRSFLEYIDLISEQVFYDPTANVVTLLTIHAAKGLEFTQVFLLGTEQDILPHAAGELDEEHRLFYVGATRAKDQLYLLHTKTRAGKNANLSQFAAALPEKILPCTIDPHMAEQTRKLAIRRQKKSQTSLF